MNSFEEQFSFLAIVRFLATLRAKEANLRHRKVFYWRYFGGGEDPGRLPFSIVSELLPPRRQWARPNRKGRGGKGRPLTQILRDAIYRKVQGVAAAGKLGEFEWGRRLESFVGEVQARVRKCDFAFERPRLWLRPKAVPIAGKTKCRCISCYERLSDRVILALANKWLANKVDPTFLDCCYSFRSTRKLTYNTAIRKLVTYRKAHNGRVYAADCDVMKFFDTVNHDAVRRAVSSRLANVDGKESFLRLLDGYLESYNLAWMMDECRRISAKSSCVADAVDIESLAYLYTDRKVELCRLGLPQGGALSGTLANMVLDAVDRAVVTASIPNLFYARYCDDILLVHKRKAECEKAIEIVQSELERVKVPIHPVEEKIDYGTGFYAAKSKGPYAWMRPGLKSRYAIPWVSFLGCCVRYDGEIRIRKETIEGHAQSMREECADFLWRVRSTCPFDATGSKLLGGRFDGAIKGLMYRLVDKGVGRVTGMMGRGIGRCWLAAFPDVWMSPTAKSQLRKLDRTRAGLLAMVRRKLGIVLRKEDASSDEVPSLYFGKPFSYAGIAERLVRAKVVRMRILKFDNFEKEQARSDAIAENHSEITAECEYEVEFCDEDEDDTVPPNSDYGRGFHN